MFKVMLVTGVVGLIGLGVHSAITCKSRRIRETAEFIVTSKERLGKDSWLPDALGDYLMLSSPNPISRQFSMRVVIAEAFVEAFYVYRETSMDNELVELMLENLKSTWETIGYNKDDVIDFQKVVPIATVKICETVQGGTK